MAKKLKDNYDLIELNESNANARGGTEITTRQIYDGTIPRELLEPVQLIPARIRDLKEDKIRVLHLHNLPNDPESLKLRDKNLYDKFHAMVFSSEYQYGIYQMVLGLPYSEKHHVIPSGIVPATMDFAFAGKVESAKKQVNLVYTSTPQRGLALLVDAFRRIAEKDPDVHLHVFSSFKLYGWDDADKPFESLFKVIDEHPQITNHGAVSNDELRQFLATEAHIHAYPCTWVETLCRAVMESASAMCDVVHPNVGALSFTTGGLTSMYQGDHDADRHTAIFHDRLLESIDRWRSSDEWVLGPKLGKAKEYIDETYNIVRVQDRWADLFESLAQQYPTAASRKFPSEMFTYNIG